MECPEIANGKYWSIQCFSHRVVTAKGVTAVLQPKMLQQKDVTAKKVPQPKVLQPNSKTLTMNITCSEQEAS